MCFANAGAIVAAEMSGISTAMQYCERLFLMVSICSLPSGVVGNLPTVSKEILSKVSRGVSVIKTCSWILALTIFCSWQTLHFLT